MIRTLSIAVCLLLVLGSTKVQAAEDGLQQGTPQLESAGALAFGPDGILFVGDAAQGAIFAIDTGDAKESSERPQLEVKGIDQAIAGQLGVTPRDILINDLAVNPASGNVYLSVSRGRGPDATPVLMRVDSQGKISEVSLKNVRFDQTPLPNVPAPGGEGRQNKRAQSITDLAYVDGRLFIAGLSNEEFASKLRAVEFPFQKADPGTSVEIYHGAHGKFETDSPIRTFVSYGIEGEPHLLAAYTCTPLVQISIKDLTPGAKIKGKTIAELGGGNRPLDMIVYEKDGKQFVLMANSRRGIMKISTEGIENAESITTKTGVAGQPYETITDWKGVDQLDSFDAKQALTLRKEGESMLLETVALP